jgi:hypothetical protein
MDRTCWATLPRCLRGSLQPLLEALPGHEVITRHLSEYPAGVLSGLFAGIGAP